MANRHTEHCSLAGFLNLFGDAWSLLILREAFYGSTRFTEFQRNTGAARNLLADRLSMLVDEGLLRRVAVGKTGSRHAYHLTDKGRSLAPVMSAMILWGNQQIYGPGQAPTVLVSRTGGQPVTDLRPALQDGQVADWQDLVVIAGPGASNAARKRFGTEVGDHSPPVLPAD